LDRPARPDTVPAPAARTSAGALAVTDAATPPSHPPARDSSELATVTTAPVLKQEPASGVDTPAALRGPLPTDRDVTRPAPKQELDAIVELRAAKPKTRPRISARELAENAAKEPAPDESDTRMRRVTNPATEKSESPEVASFAAEAKQ